MLKHAQARYVMQYSARLPEEFTPTQWEGGGGAPGLVNGALLFPSSFQLGRCLNWSPNIITSVNLSLHLSLSSAAAPSRLNLPYSAAKSEEEEERVGWSES